MPVMKPAMKPATKPKQEPRPFLKWAGGKSRLLPELERRMPSAFGRYFEPFLGGGSLFFRVQPDQAVLSDVNADLISCYQVIAARPQAVIRQLARHRDAHGKRHYYKVRRMWNEGELASKSERAAAFIYLNKTCFNGLWRLNSQGEFNVPMGRQENPKICDVDVLLAASALLKRAATIVHGDYTIVQWQARRGDFIYFDPPYDPTSSTSSFTGYTSAGFDRDDQAALAYFANVLVDQGCKVMLSNSDTPRIRRLYKGFTISRVRCRRSINADAKTRGSVGELVITGGYRSRT
jgi:DNA adenine methylase